MMPEEEARRGELARRLLDDPLLKEAFREVEEALRSAWLASADDAQAERERLWQMLRALGRVRGHLDAVVATGKFAHHIAADGRRKKGLDGT